MYIPKDCYEDYGNDLDGCSRQSSQGCKGCSYRDRKELERNNVKSESE